MEGGSKNDKIIYKEYTTEDESDDKNAQILLLGVSDEDDGDTNIMLPSGFSNNSFMLTDEAGDMEDTDIQYQFIDQDGNLVQLDDISVANLKMAQLNDYKLGWTKPMVKCLISCYGELISDFRDPSKKQKDVWSKAAHIMKENGYSVTWSHCDRKWRNLKHTFKKYYYSKNENKKMIWEYYDDLLILFSPDCMEENKGKQRMSRIILPPGNIDTSETMEVSAEEVHVDCPPKWFTDYMEQFEKRQNMRIEEMKNMHEQSLKVEQQKCKALEAILNKITNKPG